MSNILTVRWEDNKGSFAGGRLELMKHGVEITELWENAKRCVGQVPHKSPLVNRYEVLELGSEERKVVTRHYKLYPSTILYLVHLR